MDAAKFCAVVFPETDSAVLLAKIADLDPTDIRIGEDGKIVAIALERAAALARADSGTWAYMAWSAIENAMKGGGDNPGAAADASFEKLFQGIANRNRQDAAPHLTAGSQKPLFITAN
jgi:hypothetical protein